MNEDDEYFQEERKRYPGSAGDADFKVEEALRLGQLAVNLFEHTLAVAREGLRLARESAELSRQSLRLVREHLQKGKQ